MTKHCLNCGKSFIPYGGQMFCSRNCRYRYYHHSDLILPITGKWFDMILEEKKPEEYREIKPYWTKRFEKYFGKYYDPSGEIFQHVWNQQKKIIILKNGYQKNARTLEVLCSISEGEGRPEWGAEPGKKYYILKIHEIIKVTYPVLSSVVSEKLFKKMEDNLPHQVLNGFEKECRAYEKMTDEEVGECGENLSRFQAAMACDEENLEEYLDELIALLRYGQKICDSKLGTKTT